MCTQSIYSELWDDFVFHFSPKVDEQLYYRISEEEKQKIIENDPKVKMHIDLQNKKDKLEMATEQLGELLRHYNRLKASKPNWPSLSLFLSLLYFSSKNMRKKTSRKRKEKEKRKEKKRKEKKKRIKKDFPFVPFLIYLVILVILDPCAIASWSHKERENKKKKETRKKKKRKRKNQNDLHNKLTP